MTHLKTIYSDYHTCSRDFMDGLEYLKERSVSTAEQYFERAYSAADNDDPNRFKYQSYYGFSRVLNGNEDGLILCQKAMEGDLEDGDLYLNLARAQLFLGDRESAVVTVKLGLSLDKKHQGLLELKYTMGFRNYKPIPILKRNNPLNRIIGKLIRKPSEL